MITKTCPRVLFCAAILAGLTACASNPERIQAAYVSPIKYQNYDCSQLAAEMDYVTQRVNRLHAQLAKDAKADKWQMGVGLILFWPTLLALEGGDGPEAAEYAQLKGEFEAIRTASVQHKCGSSYSNFEEAVEASRAPTGDAESRENSISSTPVAAKTVAPAPALKTVLDNCVVPKTPGPISETPDQLELLNAKRALDLYQEENRVYRECLEGGFHVADSEDDRNAILVAQNAALTVEQALAEELNQELNTYQGRGN